VSSLEQPAIEKLCTGHDDFLRKPFKLDVLLERIAALLARRSR
jgi:DNA-binding response OmpR family regulator